MRRDLIKQFNKLYSFESKIFKLLMNVNHNWIMKIYIKAFYITIMYLFVLPIAINSQDIKSDMVNYYSYSIKYRFNKGTKIYFGQLFTFKNSPNQLKFTQFKIGISQKIFSNMSMNFFYKPMLFKGSTLNIWHHQLSTSVTYRSKLLALPFRNSFIADLFIPKFNKYELRFVYSAKYFFKNKILPLRATPYIKFQIYYYLNGKRVNYYAINSGDLLAKNSPNDFHRFRFGIGIRLRLVKHFYISIYYTLQEEFNTALTENRELNIWNKKQTKIKNPFNDYKIIGLNFSYSIPKIGK